MQDSFSGYHPLVNFLYFALVLVCAMFFQHPICLAISLVCALVYANYLSGRRAAMFQLTFTLPLLVMTALFNPLFSHEGATILWYFPSGNPLTLESILYGVGAATMLATVVTWFSCVNVVLTSDKFVYLFGRIIPALSLLLSMTLRFVPKFKTQLKIISNAQKCVGRDTSNGKLLQRARHGIKILSILITWALENAIETADSMKSRGYGLPGRSSFSIYRFDRRDRLALGALILLGAYVALGAALDAFDWRYFPTVRGGALSIYAASVFVAYAAMCALPMFLNLRDDRHWRTLQSPPKKGGASRGAL